MILLMQWFLRLNGRKAEGIEIAFKDFLSSGGTVVGKGKGIFTNGYQIPVGLKVEVIRPR